MVRKKNATSDLTEFVKDMMYKMVMFLVILYILRKPKSLNFVIPTLKEGIRDTAE